MAKNPNADEIQIDAYDDEGNPCPLTITRFNSRAGSLGSVWTGKMTVQTREGYEAFPISTGEFEVQLPDGRTFIVRSDHPMALTR